MTELPPNRCGMNSTLMPILSTMRNWLKSPMVATVDPDVVVSAE